MFRLKHRFLHQRYLATPTTDRRTFYIRSLQPNPDRGIPCACLQLINFSEHTLLPYQSPVPSASRQHTSTDRRSSIYPKSTTQPRLMDLLYPKSTTLPLCLLTTDSVQWTYTPLPSFQGSQSTMPPVSRLHTSTHLSSSIQHPASHDPQQST